jgi:hypothetical protein
MKQLITDLQTKRPEILATGENILTDTDKLARFIDFVSSMDLKKIKESQDLGNVNI